ncbi:GerAB/ArcD/ProY family transporter [Halobacillus sp. B23F22_1]|uniref:GerAB/ArcD/ProY family transporter n=1 Tax=Halobacillus sp. B23F22_1 TaxID=3459514 RepID=UPI00373E1213
MEKAKINVLQLFAMMFIFNMGTALVVSYGISAKKDAWIAILLGMSGGIVLFFIYYFLFRQYPNLPLTGYARKIFGKHLGWGIGLLYVVFLLYIAARDLRDFGDLLITSTMPRTPLLAVNILMVLAICYVLYLGIEVLARTTEVFFFILLFIGIAGSFFVYLTGRVDIDHLRPVLEYGWKPILTTSFPLITNFPFGEMIVFSMLLPYLNRPKSAKNVWLTAIILSGLVLSYTTSLNIAVLGLEEVEKSNFPLLTTIGRVNILEFIQRLDAFVVFTLLINTFFKTSILFYGAVIGMVDLFNLQNHRQIVFPAGVILLLLSMIIASNFVEHIEEGQNTVQNVIYPSLMLFIPLAMLLISFIKNGVKKKK